MKKPEDLSNNHSDWELLGKRPSPPLSPFFSRNVVREARLIGQTPKISPIFAWLKIALPVSVAATLIFVMGITKTTSIPANQAKLHGASTADSALDFETIKNLDQLVAGEESTVWADTSRF